MSSAVLGGIWEVVKEGTILGSLNVQLRKGLLRTSINDSDGQSSMSQRS